MSPVHSRPSALRGALAGSRARWIVVGAVAVVLVAAIAFALRSSGDPGPASARTGASSSPPPVDSSSPPPASSPAPEPTPANIYAAIGPGHLQAALAGDPARVYVPNGRSDTVSVIDPATRKVVATFPTGREPQHIVPSFDLRTLWVLDNAGNDVIPIDPATATPGPAIPVEDPYNLYFTPDGTSAIVVAEARQRLDFRDPHTMELRASLPIPGCKGINHMDYDGAGRYLLATCEFSGKLAKIDMASRTVVGLLDLAAHPVAGQPTVAPMPMPDGSTGTSMPQDVRAGPDGRRFYVADMLAGGVFVLDGDSFTVTRFVPTGVGTHGLTPARDGRHLFVANRGSTTTAGGPRGPGSVSVFDTNDDSVAATWAVPGGGSPDMGNLDASGNELWLSGRFDSEVYVFDTVKGELAARIPVGAGPHGLTVWPQPGRFSLGHTGNMR